MAGHNGQDQVFITTQEKENKVLFLSFQDSVAWRTPAQGLRELGSQAQP